MSNIDIRVHNDQVKFLFAGWEEALIWSCLDGYMGHVVTDADNNPTAAMAETGDFCFFAGRPNERLFRSLGGAKLLIPKDEGWQRLIESYYKEQVKKTLRYAIKKEKEVFDIPCLMNYVASLSQEYELRLFDQAIYNMAKSEEWSRDLCAQFEEYALYERYGLGVAILHQGKLVAGASSYGVYKGGIEIEIDTKPEYRRKGLATVCGAKIILECQERGLYPSWDAHDLRSVALAEKLGYHMDKPYVVYELMAKRIFLVVLDSFGIGYEPDAKDFGDVGSNTLHTVAQSENFQVSTMEKLGLFHIDGVEEQRKEISLLGTYGRMQECSKGKDTTVGHWEIAGILSKQPLPTYPDGFPCEIIEQLERYTGRNCICNRPYSGTEVINDFGKIHVETGALIVYTSADSVLQIAAHEEVIPLQELYRYCEYARSILVGRHGVGRVIARPFTGEYPNYVRTENRHDYSLMPPDISMLDALTVQGYDTYGIGKINDIFAGKGIQHTRRTRNNKEGMESLCKMQKQEFQGLCFVNLVDYDMLYGHRNDIDGYAGALTEFDKFLPQFMERMHSQDILMITADHGCDPGFPGTDHTREYVPFLAYGESVAKGVNIGTRESFADIAATIQALLGVPQVTAGISFMEQLLK